jgi:hypothetical protein
MAANLHMLAYKHLEDAKVEAISDPDIARATRSSYLRGLISRLEQEKV